MHNSPAGSGAQHAAKTRVRQAPNRDKPRPGSAVPTRDATERTARQPRKGNASRANGLPTPITTPATPIQPEPTAPRNSNPTGSPREGRQEPERNGEEHGKQQAQAERQKKRRARTWKGGTGKPAENQATDARDNWQAHRELHTDQSDKKDIQVPGHAGERPLRRPKARQARRTAPRYGAPRQLEEIPLRQTGRVYVRPVATPTASRTAAGSAVGGLIAFLPLGPLPA